jgi:hypothetical protein
VKLRHCPATVSAPARRPVLSAMAGNQPRLLPHRAEFPVNHCRRPLFGRVVGRWLDERKSGDRSSRPQPACVPRGTKEPSCPLFPHLFSRLQILTRAFSAHILSGLFTILLLTLSAPALPGCLHSRRGHRCHRRQGHRRQRTADQWRQGRRLGHLQPTAVFRFSPASRAASYLLVSAKSFRQLETPGFYAGRLDAVERNLVLEPEWVRESIVVTATGTPTPQPQTSAATSVLAPLDLACADDLTSALRLMPGTFVTQGPTRRAVLALHPRRGLGRQQNSPGRGQRRRSGRSIRLWTAFVHRDRARRDISRPRLQPLWRRRGQWRSQPDHPPRHHQLSLDSFPGRCGQLLHLARRTGGSRRAQQAGLPGRLQLAADRQQSAQWTSTMWPPRPPISAGSPTAARRFAPPCTTASMPPAFPAPGTFITSATTANRAIRTCTPERHWKTRPPPDFHNRLPVRPDAQARAIPAVVPGRHLHTRR